MGEPAEVIQQDLDDTRSALADKLNKLEEKISGTVSQVTETVAEVTETASETVEAVKETVQGTVETVKETVEGTVESVRHTFDIQSHVENHPWLVVGGAVLAGFVAGKLIGGGDSGRREMRRDSSWESWSTQPERTGHTWDDRGSAFTRQMSSSSEPSYGAPQSGYSGYAAQAADYSGQQDQSSGAGSLFGGNWGNWLGGLTQQIQPEVDALKGLALGAVFGLVRDMVANGLPESLKGEVSNTINSLAERFGGKTVEGPVLGSSESQSDDSPDQGQAYGSGTETASTEQSRGQPEGGKKGKKNGRYAQR